MLRHQLQKVVPEAVGHFNGRNDRKTDTGVLQSVFVFALEHREQSFLDVSARRLINLVPHVVLSLFLFSAKKLVLVFLTHLHSQKLENLPESS